MVDQAKIESIIGYHFQSVSLLTEALEAAGRAVTHETEGGMDGNKRLALVGDAILTLIHVDLWYPSEKDREIAQDAIRKDTSNINLQRLAEHLGITEEVLPNPSQKSLGRIPKTTAASTMEALLAAVWLDSDKDFEKVREVARNMGVTKHAA
ncbi:hypothetical protein H072_445 [Dactylellina haptotyla CBS 200.50]|uniref:RNase III domain-containing protein n=1 Tax=Dactylellina haptotyla (strain CBS 200.50) TaxID=1284197 RepID=S8AX22_DACHA|nr:hypothetical protein H072_445 [Dactylellina haptotyla CBS 200.50]